MLAAYEAGIMTLLFTNPIWLVKTRMQLQVRETVLRVLTLCGLALPPSSGLRGAFQLHWFVSRSPQRREGGRGLWLVQRHWSRAVPHLTRCCPVRRVRETEGHLQELKD